MVFIALNDNLPRQIGALLKEEVSCPISCVQVATTFPIISNPVSQAYVAVSPTEWPVMVTPPLAGSAGLGQSATERSEKVKYVHCTYINDLRWHVGISGRNEALSPSIASVHTPTFSPMSSKPVSHVYAMVFPTESPVDIDCPFFGSIGLGHRAENSRGN